jgi:hypothetical protein
MTSWPLGGPANGQLYQSSTDMGTMMCGNMSVEASASSTSNINVWLNQPLEFKVLVCWHISQGSIDILSRDTNRNTNYFCSLPDSPSVVPTGLLGVESNLSDLYVDRNYNMSKSKTSTNVRPHVLSVCTRYITIDNKANAWNKRRRAQNRASQRKFRNRQKKQQEELKKGYSELQQRYDDLMNSYDSLYIEYSTIKQEVKILRRCNLMHENMLPPRTSYHPAPSHPVMWEEACPESFNISLFGVSTVCNTDSTEG